VDNIADSQTAINLVERLAAVGIAIASLESLVRPETMSDTGLCSWRVHQLANKWFINPYFQRAVGWFLEYPRVLYLIAIRFVFAIALVVGLSRSNVVGAILATVIVIVSFLLTVRSTYGRDGADQMLFLTFITLAIAHSFGSPIARHLALWFLTMQLCLSYFTAGIAKLSSPIWRGGAALPGIFGTDIYGHKWVRLLFDRYPILTKAGSWSIISFECTFPIILLGFPLLTVTLLCAGTAFHLSTAVFMRLNTFLWAFIATYPAVMYCSGITKL
jgi:uncharacterized membrane protein